MHLLLEGSAIAGAVLFLLGTARRYVVQPLARAVVELRSFRAEVRNAENLSLELTKLAGSVTQIAVAFVDRLDQQQQQLDNHSQQLGAVAELLTDLDADVRRHQRGKGDPDP